MKHIKLFEEVEEKLSRLERARRADLITLPEKIEGTNCGNCKFVDLKNEYCNHPNVDQKVTSRNCCALWDQAGTKREWLNKQ
jgi:hypothetical protein